jgi:hypothetical protein
MFDANTSFHVQDMMVYSISDMGIVGSTIAGGASGHFLHFGKWIQILF